MEAFKNFFDTRPPQEKRLDAMIAQYREGGTAGHERTADAVQRVLSASPDLRGRMLACVRDGYITRLRSDEVEDNAGASYHVAERDIRVRPTVADSTPARMELLFSLGHEVEHARSQRGVDYRRETFGPAVVERASGESDGPRDYTDLIAAYIERTRAEEGRAHIGGFNAVASYVLRRTPADSPDLLRDLYESHPGRMGDFIARSVSHPVEYSLRPGLTLGENGMLAYTEENIAAMKVHYADKAQLGAAHMNYRQDCIVHGLEVVRTAEHSAAESAYEDREYRIRPDALEAAAQLGLPEDGVFRTQAMPPMVPLELDLDDTGPLVVTTAPAQVALVPQPDDPPLFAQALTAVVAYHQTDRLTEVPQELRNLAAALAVEAQAQHLTGIDRVVLTQDGTGVIASQGEGPSGRNARVEGLTAMDTPEAASLERLGQMQAQAQSVSVQSGPTLPPTETVTTPRIN